MGILLCFVLTLRNVSVAYKWWEKYPADQPIGPSRFAAIRTRIEAFAPRPGWRTWVYELLLFGFKAGPACLAGCCWPCFCSPICSIRRMRRWHADMLTLAALGVQVAMLALRLESREEAWVIAAFHVVGTVMELFKPHKGHGSIPRRAFCGSAMYLCFPASCMPRWAAISPASSASLISASATIPMIG
jgi:hypothetical protein